MRLLRALGSLALLAGVLVGVPWVLSAWSSPTALLHARWPDVLLSPDDGTLLVGMLGLVGWAAWLVVAATIVSELVAVLSRQRLRVELPGTAWLRPAVTMLVAGALLAPQAAHAAPATPAPAPTPTAPTAAPSAPAAQPEVPATGDSRPVDCTGRWHTVRPGEELWTVAELRLGSGERWRDLLVLNPTLDAQSRLTPGQRLVLPPDVQVQPGDSLWRLAERHLGDAERWTEIHELNTDLITDPDRIDVGWRLLLPTDDAPPSEPRQPPERQRPGSEPAASGPQQQASPEATHPSAAPEAPTPATTVAPTATAGPGPEQASADTPRPAVTPSVTAAPTPTGTVAPTPTGTQPRSAESSPPGPPASPTEAPATAHVPPVPAPGPTAGSPATSPATGPSNGSIPGTPGAETAAHGDAVAEVRESESNPVAHIGGLLASVIVVGVAARRRLQVVGRAVGRRLIPLSPATARFWTALGRKADESGGLDDATADGEPMAPTSVVLGWRDDGSQVVLDVEGARCTSIDEAPEPQAVIAAMVTSLLCAPWSEEVEVLLVGADQPWATAIDDPRLRQITDAAAAVSEVTRRCAQRRIALGPRLLDEVRSHPDTAPSWAPQVVLFAKAPTAEQSRELQSALQFGRVGVSVVGVGLGTGTRLRYTEHGCLHKGERFEPQLLTTAARRAIVDLFAATSTPESHAAPWWDGAGPRRAAGGGLQSHPSPEAFAPLSSPPRRGRTPGEPAPSLVLLGEPAIVDANGERPQRASQQCIEYCAWLLFHPGANAQTMAAALCVAEGTRRSNLSRLRTWLGVDAAGARFLPDAYNGRIRLDERVTSDWHRLLDSLDGPVRQASDDALRRALGMVTGAPLGTAASRWPWARALHDDMVAIVVDMACEYADRALRTQRLDDALWALELVEHHLPGHDEVRIRLVKVHSRRPDKSALGAAADTLLRGLRDDNREIAPHHARDLDDALESTRQPPHRIPAATASLATPTASVPAALHRRTSKAL